MPSLFPSARHDPDLLPYRPGLEDDPSIASDPLAAMQDASEEGVAAEYGRQGVQYGHGNTQVNNWRTR